MNDEQHQYQHKYYIQSVVGMISMSVLMEGVIIESFVTGYDYLLFINEDMLDVTEFFFRKSQFKSPEFFFIIFFYFICYITHISDNESKYSGISHCDLQYKKNNNDFDKFFFFFFFFFTSVLNFKPH